METIDQIGLAAVSTIIRDAISVQGIYCIGARRDLQTTYNSFNAIPYSRHDQVHFYLMVATASDCSASIPDISGIKTKHRYTLTLLSFCVQEGLDPAIGQLYFYHEVVSKGFKVYEVPGLVPVKAVPDRDGSIVRSYWSAREKIAATFLESEHQLDYSDTGFVQDTMMHLAVEQLCLGLIHVFLGYQPAYFSLDYLFSICALFTPLASDVFPRISSEDKRLFALLQAPPSALRSCTVQASCLTDTRLLDKRCHLFYRGACVLVQEELARLGGSGL